MLDILALIIAGVFILPFKGISLIMDGDFGKGIPTMVFGFALWTLVFNW